MLTATQAVLKGSFEALGMFGSYHKAPTKIEAQTRTRHTRQQVR
jgi:hypothetical protein